MTKYIGVKTVILAFIFPCILCCPVDDTSDPTISQEVGSQPQRPKRSYSHTGRG